MGDCPILFSAPSMTRFWSKVDRKEGLSCWNWIGPTNASGYGRFHAEGRSVMAHRVTVWLSGRSIPNGMEVDHICRNRSCVNPEHLRVVTHRENLLAGETITARAAATTNCPKGHLLVGGNLLISKDGRRKCRECDRIRVAANYEPTTTRRRRPHLSDNDRSEIVGLIENGLSHSEISKKLGVSLSTVSRVRNSRGAE